jgi:hypothetical protein
MDTRSLDAAGEYHSRHGAVEREILEARCPAVSELATAASWIVDEAKEQISTALTPQPK